MVLVLIAAAVVSGAIGELVDTLAIVVIVVLNAVIGFVQAWRADKAMAALQQLAAAHATVLRDGEVRQIPAAGLVPGDIVLLEAGNQVPADLRLIDLAQFRMDESALTGESVTVEKHAAPMTGVVHALGDRLNMAFKGTTATHGRARGLVVATGMSTELGKVATLLDRDTDRSTPLQRRLAAFGKRLSLAVIAICGVLFTVGVLRGEPPMLMALTAISLAVAAIPEALPAVVTVLLALGARKMVTFNALIRRLPSVETLGSVSFICSDKTGTLTQNRMHAEVLLADGESWQPGEPSPKPVHQELLRAAALCNDATHTLKGGWAGDPTETALTQVAGDAGLHKPTLEQDAQRVLEFPFDAERKRMTTFHRTPDGLVAYTKGAPEAVLAQCTSQWQPGGESPLRRAPGAGCRRKAGNPGAASAGTGTAQLRAVARHRRTRSGGKRSVPDRPDWSDRPPAARGGCGGARLHQRRHHAGHDHGRPPRHGPGNCPAPGHRGRHRGPGAHRRRPGGAERRSPERAGAPGAHLRAGRSPAKDPHRGSAAGAWRVRGHDGRRRQ
jgi:Ca2+-transporting ATPase